MNESEKDELLKLIHQKNWSNITKNFSIENLTKTLDFKECMSLAYDLFFKNFHDDDTQDFAVRLFFLIKDNYQFNWDNDWKNDAFLGQLCGLTWRYDERYESYKKAYDKLTDPPDSLLLLMAECNSAPGVPSISDQESEQFLKKAVEKKITYEVAIMLRGLYRSKNEIALENYWNKMCEELDRKNIHTDTIKPDILADKF